MSFDIKRALHKEVNIGLKERQMRYWAGSALLLISVFLGNIALLFLGGFVVYTAFSRWCPAYSGLNKSTVDPNEPPAACCGHSHEH